MSEAEPAELPAGFSGDYASWAEASVRCTDYVPEYEDKVREATLAVLLGYAAHTRDGVLFPKIEYSWPLLAGLMYCAASAGGRLSVLDFGGSLGVTYLQNRRFLDRLPAVEWHIVERGSYAEYGRSAIRHERIRFHDSVDACLAAHQPDVLLLSCVLQSLPDPYGFLATLLGLPFRHLLIDRLPLNAEPRDRLTIFRTYPSIIANMSRPWWFFDEQRLLSVITGQFELIEAFDGFEGANIPSRYVGYVCSRRAG
jgi:putative methyltransferase (TIGR04325 family)